MAILDTANPEGTAPETASIHYVGGNGICFAYRQLSPSTGTTLVLLQYFSGRADSHAIPAINGSRW